MSERSAAYAVDPAPVSVLPIAGSDLVFPVHRVYCVGRNYAAHSIEMGGDPIREPPFFFQKNSGNLDAGGSFPYPSASSDVHHEIEMLVALKSGGVDIPVADALGCVYGYGVALDMTRRDLQAQAKQLAQPWEVAKAFDHSAPCTAIFPADRIGHPTHGAIWLDVNEARRQTGDLNQMIWKVPEMISCLSGLFRLRAGDVLLSGTPAGVGAIRRGDLMHGHIDGIGDLEVRVV